MTGVSKFDIEQVTLLDIVITNAIVNHNSNFVLTESKNNIQFWFTPAVNIIEKTIRIIVSFEIKAESVVEPSFSVSGKFDVAFFFLVQNLQDLINGNNDSPAIVLDKDVTIALSNIAYSTSRGIVFTRCQGTALGKVIIPILTNDKLVSIFNERTKI